ncbi:hypothetical protein FORC47_p269 (plasmid) [Bacillus cereus]|nr:insertion element protein [Bacillus cereus]ASL62613.1 insertion element protein [Bacillus cereus]ASL62621.1 hypothetical protein FORC47_p269 [Bacillus cereus]
MYPYSKIAIFFVKIYKKDGIFYESFDKQKLKPAQRLGITDKRFKIYFIYGENSRIIYPLLV